MRVAAEVDEEMVARWWWGSVDDDGGDNDVGVVMMVMSTVGRGGGFRGVTAAGWRCIRRLRGKPRVRASGYGDRVYQGVRRIVGGVNKRKLKTVEMMKNKKPMDLFIRPRELA
ncbi:hypothetical protein Tco_0386040 [Tanacetum coccineum]